VLSPVCSSPDYVRIKNLPMRTWSGRGEIADRLNEWLRLPGSSATLRPVQIAALQELYDYGGLFGPIRVGAGKTLLSLLAPVVLDAQRPLLLAPAAMVREGGPLRREAQEYAKDWRVARNLSVLSYEKFSRVESVDFLDRHSPDLLILDECHRCKDTRRSRARRIRRYLSKNPDCRVLAMSGSIAGRSLKDYWHLVRWCLPTIMPMPRDMAVLISWCEALDEKVFLRRPAGVLTDLHPDAVGETELDKARNAYSLRFSRTPGIVATSDDVPAIGLTLSGVSFPVNHATLDPAFSCLREKWETPDGQPFETAIDLWRHAREMALGFWYKWEPPPPKSWLTARRNWSAYCRKILSSNKRGWDTPAALALAIDRGQLNDGEILAEWRAIQDSFRPNTVANWIDDSAINYAAEWLRREGGLVWVEHRAFGDRLSQESGVPYFRAQGCTNSGYHIYDHKGRGGAIASVQSLGTGMNLQAWSKNLVTSHLPSGRHWEQTLGRTHRDGQEADEVSVDVVLTCVEQWNGVQRAIRDAEYIEQTTGSLQKLVYATKDLPTSEEIILRGRNDYLWR